MKRHREDRATRLAREIAAGRDAGVRSLFRRHGARSPSILWQPRAAELTSPALADLLRWWSALPKIGRVPRAARSSIALPTGVGDHFIAESAKGGAELLCRRLDGAPMHATESGPSGASPWLPGGHEALFDTAACRAVLARRQPVHIAYVPTRDLEAHADALILPLLDPVDQTCYLMGARTSRLSSQALFDAMMDGAVVFDGDGRIRMVNATMASMLGSTPAQLHGRPVTDFVRAPFLATGLKTRSGVVGPAREAELQGAGGREVAVQISVGVARIGRSEAYLAVVRDDSAHKALEDHYRTLALTDPLTGLANRVLFSDRIGQALIRARRARRGLALLMIDLDGFKGVNDRFGHPAGDVALQEFAHRLRSVTREADVLARLGGDEFALVQTDLEQPDGVQALADRLLAALAEPVLLGEQPLTLGASIGIAVFPDDGDSIGSLAEHADRALYNAKARGGRCWIRFRHDHHEDDRFGETRA